MSLDLFHLALRTALFIGFCSPILFAGLMFWSAPSTEVGGAWGDGE